VGRTAARGRRRHGGDRTLAALSLHGGDLNDGPIADLIEAGAEIGDASLLDLVDHLLNQGVVLQAEVVLGLASIDLIYVRLTAVVCGADRVAVRRAEE
jgi:hypothetical protein